MPRVERSLLNKSVACLFILALTSGCSNTLSQQLLSDRTGPDSGIPTNKLALPPADALEVAQPDANPAFVEESNLPADVPTLTELSTRPVEGIDAPKVGLSLEEDIASQKIEGTVLWRGKRSADGMDLANRNGALCSGVSRDVVAANTIRVACSDGRIGIVKLTPNTRRAVIAFKSGAAEAVDLEN
jgi:hypothetical protein